MWHHAGAGGREVARQRSDLVDILFKELFEGVVRSVVPKGLSEPLVVTALGGYGRRELTPFSDIDIMFTTAKPQPGKASEEVIRKTLTTLLDIGYKVGHSEINKLRDGARKSLGARFDLRQFDDAVVKSGNVPLTLLAQVIQESVKA